MDRWGLKITELEALILSVGEHHLTPRPLSPVEVARMFQLALNNGATKKDCADLVHFSGTTMVSRFTSLLSLAPSIRHFVDWGISNETNLGFSTASELSKLPKNDQEECFTAIISHHLKKTEVEEIRQIINRSDKTVSQSIHEILRARPSIKQQFVYIGTIDQPATIRALRAMNQNTRDSLLEKVLFELEIANVRGRLAPASFSLIGGHTFREIIESVDDLESVVTNSITRYLESQR